MRNISVKLFQLRPVVHEEMLLKKLSYLQLWQPFCYLELNHLASIKLYHVEAHRNIWRINRYLTLLLYFSDSE